jgi:dTDP-4-dehydrorhamnose 3,5-epimerase
MLVHPTTLPGVVVVQSRRFQDDRGYFVESYNLKTFTDAGISCIFVQDNQSLSVTKGTIRGLHFQAPPFAQAKLVRCTRGAIFDVAVDIRKGSATYGQWIGEELSVENGRQLFIPAGFAHGFCTLEPMTEVAYKVDAHYSAACEGGIIFDDPDLAIDWRLEGEPVLSAKDRLLSRFANLNTPFQS